MSRIKKAVLFILVIVGLVLITMPANATGNAKFGWTQINSDTMNGIIHLLTML